MAVTLHLSLLRHYEKNMKKDRLWTRSYILNDMTCFVINVPFYMLMVVITGYATEYLDASLSEAGLAAGAFVIGAMIARITMGGQIEHIGLKKSLYIGLSIFLLGLALNLLVCNILWLTVVRVLQGFGFGIASTTIGAMMAYMVPQSRRGEGTSYFAMFVTLATAVGPYFGTLLYNGSLNGILALGMALVIMCMICAGYISVPRLQSTPRQNDIAYKIRDHKVIGKFIEPRIIPIAAITFLVNLGFAAILSFISSFEAEAGLTAAGEYYFIVYACLTLLSRPFTGRLFDRLGANVVMYPSFVIFAIGLFLISIASRGWHLLLAAACMGIGYGTFISCAQAIAIMFAPSDRMGIATSTFFMFMELSLGIGPALMGMIIPHAGYRGLFLILASLQFVCAYLYYLTVSRKITRHKTPII